MDRQYSLRAYCGQISDVLSTGRPSFGGWTAYGVEGVGSMR
jgi:hypothetical protein